MPGWVVLDLAKLKTCWAHKYYCWKWVPTKDERNGKEESSKIFLERHGRYSAEDDRWNDSRTWTASAFIHPLFEFCASAVYLRSQTADWVTDIQFSGLRLLIRGLELQHSYSGHWTASPRSMGLKIPAKKKSWTTSVLANTCAVPGSDFLL